MLLIDIIPLLRDNYAYLICDNSTGTTGIIDPSTAGPILKYLGNKKLDYILNTHHHWDHTDGNSDLKKSTKAKIIAPEMEKWLIPDIDIAITGNFKFGNCTVEVIHVPGHTLGHIAFFFREDKALFCGDTLFIGGCGRVFEGTIDQMYNNMQTLKKLPMKQESIVGMNILRIMCVLRYR